MGYRSEVAFACNESVYKENKELLTNFAKPDEEAMNAGVYRVKWSYIKWYPSYEDVAAIEKLLEKYPDDTALVRVGEEAGDVEIKNDPYQFGIGYSQGVYI